MLLSWANHEVLSKDKMEAAAEDHTIIQLGPGFSFKKQIVQVH